MSDLPSPPLPTAFPPGLANLLPEVWTHTGVGLCLTDSTGIIRMVNAAFSTITGYATDELVGVSLIRLQPAESAVASTATHATIIEGNTPASAVTYLHKSGRPLFTHTTDARLVAGSGQVYRLTSLIDLDHEARSSPRLEQLQRAENFVMLAGAISNDFNNLLAIIMGYTSYLQDAPDEPRRVHEAVRGIDLTVQRAADLIKQTLYLTRQTPPTFQRVDLGQLAEDMIRTLSSHESWALDIALTSPPDLPATTLDPRHLDDMIRRLCRKAVDAFGPGIHVRLALMAMSGPLLQVRFSEAREPLYVMLEIRLKPRPGAPRTGVGWNNHRDFAMIAMESLMALHRGCCERVVLEDEEVAFRLYFPTLPETTPVGASARGDGRTVLLIDDEESLLHALGYALERHGCRVLKARDGLQAVELHRQHRDEIAMVLCDLGLPGMSGWEAFMKMKETDPEVRVIMMSGHLDPSLNAEIHRAGACGFLQKPFAIAKAVAQVQEHLNKAG